jgi:hypothetical protein
MGDINMRKINNPKNLLVQYKGGGYDGCFWEWNYFVFDSNGQFHDIASSGYRGIKDAVKALELLNASPDRFNQFYTYKLTSKKALNEFQAECAEQHVSGVVDKVNKIYAKDIMFWKCDSCENKQFDGEMHHDSYKGNGGIGVQMLGKLCEECYSCGMCDHCGEYDAEDKTLVDIGGSEYYCCKYCAESLKEKTA